MTEWGRRTSSISKIIPQTRCNIWETACPVKRNMIRISFNQKNFNCTLLVSFTKVIILKMSNVTGVGSTTCKTNSTNGSPWISSVTFSLYKFCWFPRKTNCGESQKIRYHWNIKAIKDRPNNQRLFQMLRWLNFSLSHIFSITVPDTSFKISPKSGYWNRCWSKSFHNKNQTLPWIQ